MKTNQFENFEIQKADLIKVKGGKAAASVSTGQGRVLDNPGMYCDRIDEAADGSMHRHIYKC